MPIRQVTFSSAKQWSIPYLLAKSNVLLLYVECLTVHSCAKKTLNNAYEK